MRLTKEFKEEVSDFILRTCQALIPAHFAKTDQHDSEVELEGTDGNKSYNIRIKRSCFPQHNDKPYYEDYSVLCKVDFNNQKVYSKFFIEWVNNDPNTCRLQFALECCGRGGNREERVIRIIKCTAKMVNYSKNKK
jgi:hypothetical protein